MVYQTTRQLRELGDKVGADVKAPVEAALQKLEDAIRNKSPVALLKSSMQALQEVRLHMHIGCYPLRPSILVSGESCRKATFYYYSFISCIVS